MINKTEVLIKNIFCQILGIKQKDFSDSIAYNSFDKWDSLRHLQIIAKLEETFDIDIDMDDVIGMENFKKAKKIVKKYLKTKIGKK